MSRTTKIVKYRNRKIVEEHLRSWAMTLDDYQIIFIRMILEGEMRRRKL